jgi:hypothetical protein
MAKKKKNSEATLRVEAQDNILIAGEKAVDPALASLFALSVSSAPMKSDVWH